MEKITMDSLLEFQFLGNLKVSPDEKRYAFISAQAAFEKNAYHHTLYLGEADNITKLRKLKKNNDFTFLDNHRILINYQKNKTEQNALKDKHQQSHYLYNLKDRTLEKTFTLPLRAKIEAVLPNEVLLLSSTLTVEDHILYEGTEEQRKTYLEDKKKTSAYEVIEQLPYYFNGRDFITDQCKQLLLYDMKNERLKRVFDKTFSLEQFLLSQDKKTIYYTGKPIEKVMTFTSNIFAYDIESDTHRTLYDKKDHSITKLIEFKDGIVVAAKDMQTYGLNENPHFYTLKNNTLKLLAKHGQSFGNTIGTDCRLLGSESTFVKDDTFYFISTIDDHSEIMALKFDGTLKTVFKMDGAIDGFVKHGSHALLLGMRAQELQAVYRYDFETAAITKLSTLNDTALKNKYVANPQEIVVQKENHEVKGFVLLPNDYDANKKYPAILNIHGGPKTVYGQIFYHEMQYWANEGYLVMFANPRGSDGKGDQFADIRGKYGTIDYDDLMDFVDLVISRYPAIDADRLYVTGGSYGGFMTNWMIGHTDRFKAAATQRSISNWLSFYGTSDIGFYFASDQTDGHPLEDRENLYEQSPIKYAKNIKTPTLILHSDKDHRCPMEQAQQFYAVLSTQGVDTRLVWMKGENHELSRGGKPQARFKRLEEITQWFKTH